MVRIIVALLFYFCSLLGYAYNNTSQNQKEVSVFNTDACKTFELSNKDLIFDNLTIEKI